ncbi:MAG: hypothetical protein M1308_13155, partial [Actinobacteria bacterium]|nr:hypothetical protein [Actinomycetota bacterium]
MIAIKENFKSHDGYFKNTQAFPQRVKASSVSGFALLPEEEPCPLKPSNGFLNTHPGLSIYFLSRN